MLAVEGEGPVRPRAAGSPAAARRGRPSARASTGRGTRRPRARARANRRRARAPPGRPRRDRRSRRPSPAPTGGGRSRARRASPGAASSSRRRAPRASSMRRARRARGDRPRAPGSGRSERAPGRRCSSHARANATHCAHDTPSWPSIIRQRSMPLDTTARARGAPPGDRCRRLGAGRSVGPQPVTGGSCRRITLLRLRRLRLRTCPPPPARGPSLPRRAPALASRSARVYCLRDRSSCAESVRRRSPPEYRRHRGLAPRWRANGAPRRPRPRTSTSC